jgi:hypothetical protein
MKLIVCFILGMSAVSAAKQHSQPQSKAQLATVEARGKRLANYDSLVVEATRAVASLRLNTGDLQIIAKVGKQAGKQKEVAFGKLTANRDGFLIYFKTKDRGQGETIAVENFNPPLQDSAYYLFAARALKRASEDLPKSTVPYTAIVVPDESLNGNRFLVYMYPVGTHLGQVLGNDLREEFSGDGLDLLDRRRLHQGFAQVPSSQKSKSEREAHSCGGALCDGQLYDVLDSGKSGYSPPMYGNTPEKKEKLSDLVVVDAAGEDPQETDVFFTVVRHAPTIVIAPYFVYHISPDGKIKAVPKDHR